VGAPAHAPLSASQSGDTGGGEQVIFDDEFSGPAGAAPDPSAWRFDVGGGGWGDGQLQSDTERAVNASLNGAGQLVISARREAYSGADGIRHAYTSARLTTLGHFQFQYGDVEARIRVPAGQGLVAQFWALGSEAYERDFAWPGCGEIDMAEVLGSEPETVLGHLHGPWPFEPNDGLGVRGGAGVPLSDGFHDFGARWQPGQVSFTLDGSTYGTLTPADLPPGSAWPFSHPFFLVLDLAVGGTWPGAPTSATPFPAQMLVDWVRVRR
jgi:beta-glucanase (GH16 family)